MERDVVIVSGAFDPIHRGHLNLFEEASKIGRLIVCLNSDEWLARKKGQAFMCFEDRKYMIGSLIWVTKVIGFDDEGGTACDCINKVYAYLRYQKGFKGKIFFANGGCEKDQNEAEIELCNDLDIDLLWNVGGKQLMSSDNMLKKWCHCQIKALLEKYLK